MRNNIPHYLLLCMVTLLSLPVPATDQKSSEDPISATQHAKTPMGAFLGAKNTIHPDWFKESFLEFEEDIDEATAAGRRLVLYFHQDGCPYCNLLVEHNFTDGILGKKVQQHFDVVAINMWGDREVVQVGGRPFTEKTLAAALDVNFTPTLLFFDEARQVVLRLDGYLPPEEFDLALGYVANRLESHISWADHLAKRQRPVSGELTTVMNRALAPPYDLTKTAKGRPLAVFFEEPDCENCRLLHEKSFRHPDADPLLKAFDIIQLNRWADTPIKRQDGTSTTASQWAGELEISFIPAMVLFDPDGKIILKVNAQFRTFHILGALAYAADGAYRNEPSFQRYLSARAETIRERGVDVDIWKY